MNNSRSLVRTIFLAESSVRQPLVACRKVKQILEKRQFFGPRREREGRASFAPNDNERSENKGGENRKVV
jgi:hypothetical protein